MGAAYSVARVCSLARQRGEAIVSAAAVGGGMRGRSVKGEL